MFVSTHHRTSPIQSGGHRLGWEIDPHAVRPQPIRDIGVNPLKYAAAMEASATKVITRRTFKDHLPSDCLVSRAPLP